MKNTLKNLTLSILALAVLALAVPAFADDAQENQPSGPGISASGSVQGTVQSGGFLHRIFGGGPEHGEEYGHPMPLPASIRSATAGTVTAVSGTTITITAMRPDGTTPTLTVDASNSTVLYRGTQSSVSSIKVGDKIIVNGTLSGTTITATAISAGITLPGAVLHDIHPGTVGKVTAVSGTTLTITSQPDPRTKTTKTFTVDATAATVMKSSGTGTIADITVGSVVLVEGTVSGSTITATMIRVSDMSFEHGEFANIKSNGQPVIEGKITAISDTTITVSSAAPANSTGGSTAAAVVYTVDASKATIAKAGVSAATVTNLSVGDMVIIQGAVNGSAVVAATIIDHPMQTGGDGENRGPGFFHAIGNFFSRIFGHRE